MERQCPIDLWGQGGALAGSDHFAEGELEDNRTKMGVEISHTIALFGNIMAATQR